MVDNLITVTIGNSRKVTSRPVWLTDKGMILKFVGIELPNYYVVDFARSVTDEALPVIGGAEGVAIPSELFHNADKIFAWLRITNGDNSHYTAYQVTIPLLQRSEISGSQPTPEQEDIIDQAIAAMNEAGSEAAAAAESAAQSAAEIDAKLGGGGITGEEYVTMFGGEFTVTTAADETHEHPYGEVNLTGDFDKNDAYRVTFDGDVYFVPAQLFTTEDHSGNASFTGYTYVGNLSLFHLPIDGTLNEQYDAPFLILRNKGKINVYTNVAGEHSVLVERIIFDFERIPANLIYGDMYVPFQQKKTTSKVYEGYSVGCNRFLDGRFMYAFGYGNVVSGEGACAIGAVNRASGSESMALGFNNTASGSYSTALGNSNSAIGSRSVATGQRTIALGGGSHVEGDGTRANANFSHVEGGGTYADASQMFTHIGGVNNAVSTETSNKTITVTRYNADGTVQSTSSPRTLGKYAEVIGNGDSDQARSNARTLDWDGNEGLAGGLTLGMGTEDEIHITPVQLKALLNLI